MSFPSSFSLRRTDCYRKDKFFFFLWNWRHLPVCRLDVDRFVAQVPSGGSAPGKKKWEKRKKPPPETLQPISCSFTALSFRLRSSHSSPLTRIDGNQRYSYLIKSVGLSNSVLPPKRKSARRFDCFTAGQQLLPPLGITYIKTKEPRGRSP